MNSSRLLFLAACILIQISYSYSDSNWNDEKEADYTNKGSICERQRFGDCRSCNKEQKREVICYFTNWATYRSGRASFNPENINASLCTVINYGLAILDPTTLLVKESDSYADYDKKFFELVTAFKKFGLKVLLSIGGWNNSLIHWSKMFNDVNARDKFIKNLVQFLLKYNFDGLDMDYEYPCGPQGDTTVVSASDVDTFNVLMSEIREAFTKEKEASGKYLYLTMAIGAGETKLKSCYHFPGLVPSVDWINLMTYDYYSAADGFTGANAPLCSSGSSWGVFDSVSYLVENSLIPPSKLTLGLPFYGKTYTLKAGAQPQFGQPVEGPGPAGTYTLAAGTLAYYEICLNLNSGWKYGYTHVNGSYIYKDNVFVSYDGQTDIFKKACLVHQFNLLGAFFWALDYDDFNNMCGKGSYPLLKTLNNVLGYEKKISGSYIDIPTDNIYDSGENDI